MKGIIQKDGTVIGEDNELYKLPFRGTDDYGYPEVLIDARKLGKDGPFRRQSIKDFIGATVEFEPYGSGYNFEIISKT